MYRYTEVNTELDVATMISSTNNKKEKYKQQNLDVSDPLPHN